MIKFFDINTLNVFNWSTLMSTNFNIFFYNGLSTKSPRLTLAIKIFSGEKGEKTYINGSNFVTNYHYKY